MQLNGEQRKRFHNALLNAFPSISNLRQMVSFELNENVDAIAMGENYSDIVFKLIIWAETQGKVKHLLTAARESNPGNFELRSFAETVELYDYTAERKYFYPTTINSKTQADDLSSEAVDYTRLGDLLKAGK